MEHLLTWMEKQKVPLVKLDASPAGQPLYEKLGFVPLEEVYVFQQRPGRWDRPYPRGIHLVTAPYLDLITASDTRVFGADRSRLLRALLRTYPVRAFRTMNEQGQLSGYLIVQAKRIGPWIMNESSDAERLLLAALSLPFDGKVSVITPANNAEAVSLLKRYGFQIVRVNRHMAYGPGMPTGQREKIYGQTSLSFG
jgi:hypothetical protein